MMLVESLPNETFLLIFEYLDTHHLIRTFSQLNTRFNSLLQFYFQFHRLNFGSVSKDEYDYISRNFLPFIIDKISSLCLSNDETPDLPKCFLSQGFTLDRFIHLQSLSLSNIYSLSLLNQIISQCRSLQFLTHLNIFNNYQNEFYTEITNLLNNIWNLKKLIYCQLNGICYVDTNGLFDISTISTSIQYLSIEHILSNLTSLSHLFKHTPSLRRFHGLVHSYLQNDQFDFNLSSLKSLKLSFGGSFQSLEKLLKTCSNLTYLNIDMSRVYINGHQWQYLIVNYLLNLKTFNLRMTFCLNSYNYNHEIGQILESFRSIFWIEERQWFVQYRWNPSDRDRLITLYTLPHVLGSVDCLNFNPITNQSHFYIELPRHDISKLNFSTLNSLKSLDLSLYRLSSYSQLQLLFNQTPNLYSLKIKFAIDLLEHFFNLTSTSIQRLNFLEQPIYFNRSDCLNLIKSSLGQQCQVLLIRIKSRNSILDFIQQMIHLRLLVVHFENDIDLTQWLKQNLSSNDFIIQDSKNECRFHIWIDRQIKRTFSYRNQLIQYFERFFN